MGSCGNFRLPDQRILDQSLARRCPFASERGEFLSTPLATKTPTTSSFSQPSVRSYFPFPSLTSFSRCVIPPNPVLLGHRGRVLVPSLLPLLLPLLFMLLTSPLCYSFSPLVCSRATHRWRCQCRPSCCPPLALYWQDGAANGLTRNNEKGPCPFAPAVVVFSSTPLWARVTEDATLAPATSSAVVALLAPFFFAFYRSMSPFPFDFAHCRLSHRLPLPF